MNIMQKPKSECEKEIVSIIQEYSKNKDKIILGIVGGRSISSILNKILTSELDVEKIEIFLLDERYVPLDDDESNYKLINETIKDKIKLNKFNFQNSSPEDYTNLLNNKIFDIIILSSGEDGHIASLFPNHPSIKNEEEGFIKVENSPKPPEERMSASKSLLQKSKVGMLLFFGNAKKQAFENFQNNALSVTDCPAKIMKEINNSYVFVDVN